MRWQRFTAAVLDAMERGVPFSQEAYRDDITEFEYQWTLRKDKVTIVSGEYAVAVARELAKKYDVMSKMCTLK